jgi:DNA-binding NtrC family response regulator
MNQYMEMERYDPDQATTENELLDRLKAGVDVALLDMSSFGFRGVALLDRINQVQPQIPVICLMPQGMTQLSMAVMQHGAYDEVVSPFSKSTLLKTIASAHKDRKRFTRKEKRGLWQRLEDSIVAGSLAEAGAGEMAREWLRQQQEKKGGNNDR